VTIHAAACTTRSTGSNRSTGWVHFALVAIVVVPAIAGSLRLVELARGPHLLPANPRLTASPVPLVVHIVNALAYASHHPAWMTRACALALGGGTTQVLTQGSGKALFDTSELTSDLCQGADWVINLAVADYVIRRSARRRAIISRPIINSRRIGATAKVGSS
jgi:hypothetical protein